MKNHDPLIGVKRQGAVMEKDRSMSSTKPGVLQTKTDTTAAPNK